MSNQLDPQQLAYTRDFILLMTRTIRKHTQRYERDYCDLTRNEWRILYALDSDQALLVKEISQQFTEVSASTLTRLLDQLEEKECIQRTIPTNDRRSILISLTERGKEIKAAFPKQMERLAETMLKELDTNERIMLINLFQKIQSRFLDVEEKNHL